MLVVICGPSLRPHPLLSGSECFGLWLRRPTPLAGVLGTVVGRSITPPTKIKTRLCVPVDHRLVFMILRPVPTVSVTRFTATLPLPNFTFDITISTPVALVVRLSSICVTHPTGTRSGRVTVPESPSDRFGNATGFIARDVARVWVRVAVYMSHPRFDLHATTICNGPVARFSGSRWARGSEVINSFEGTAPNILANAMDCLEDAFDSGTHTRSRGG